MRAGELTLLSADGSIGCPTWSSAGNFIVLVKIREIWPADQLRYHSGPDPGLWLSLPKICIMCELLGHMKGPVLLILSGRLSHTQDKNRVTLDEESLLMVSQKPEASNQTSDSLQ